MNKQGEKKMSAKQLTMGINSPKTSKKEQAKRIQDLKDTITKYLPDFPKMAAKCKQEDASIILHQDAFAAGYDEDEYILLGMAVKYAGLFGIRIIFTGTNHETF
jgi:hypothetical protein